MDSTSGGCGVESSEPKSLVISSTASTTPNVEGSSRALSCRYESQKRRDWKTFLLYLENHKPPLAIASCSASHVIEFMRHLDQFGKTKMHLPWCVNFGRQNSPAVCDCPLKQAWGSLDALIGRLRAAYEENGGDPEINPFGARDVRLYLKELREVQAKARGIPYLKKRKRPTTTSTSVSVAGITQVVDRSTGSVGGSVSGGFVTSTDRTAQVIDGYSCNGGAGGGGYTCDVNAVVTSVSELTRVVDASGDSDGSATFDSGGVVAPMTGISQAIDDKAGACRNSTSDAVGVVTSMTGVTQAIDGSTGGCGDSKSDAGRVLTSMAGITHVVDGGSTSKSGWLVSTEITQLVDGVISSGGGGSTSDADGVVNDEKMMTPMLIPGTLVEVNLPDMQCHDAWVPAKILKVGYNQSVFLVGYKNSRLSYDEWCSKATVDALHIRPSPPEKLEGKNFHVSEKVDFYYDWGWWSGEVTKVLVDNRYNVRSDYHKIEREFNQFELRCHAEWINGRWVQDSRDIGTKQDQVDVTENDQADLLPVCNTEVIATESNTRKQMTGPPAAESSKGTSSQLEGSSDHPVPDLGLDKTGSVEDCGTCGRHETAVYLNFSALSSSDKKQLELSETQAQCSEMDLAVSSPKDCTKSHGEVTESSMVLIADPEKAIPTPKSLEGLSEHPSLNFDQESALWTIETEQCEISDTQVEPIDLAIVPLSTQAPDEQQQQCRRNGTRWRCSKIAVTGKLYCERHLLERSIHNDKRRKTPRVERIVDALDGKRCRRSGTGWRCHEMVSPGKQHCEKHRLLLDTYNEKRRKKVIEPVDQIQINKDHQQCMRKGRGWRCPEMVSPGKRYCDKH